MRTVIKDIEHLKKLSDGYIIDCFIILNFGAKTSKDICYYPADNSWYINHNISDTEVEYKNDEEFKENEPFIFEAIEKNAFFAY